MSANLEREMMDSGRKDRLKDEKKEKKKII